MDLVHNIAGVVIKGIGKQDLLSLPLPPKKEEGRGEKSVFRT